MLLSLRSNAIPWPDIMLTKRDFDAKQLLLGHDFTDQNAAGEPYGLNDPVASGIRRSDASPFL